MGWLLPDNVCLTQYLQIKPPVFIRVIKYLLSTYYGQDTSGTKKYKAALTLKDISVEIQFRQAAMNYTDVFKFGLWILAVNKTKCANNGQSFLSSDLVFCIVEASHIFLNLLQLSALADSTIRLC